MKGDPGAIAEADLVLSEDENDGVGTPTSASIDDPPQRERLIIRIPRISR